MTMAVHNGLADRSILNEVDTQVITLDKAFEVFINDRSKARVAGGVQKSTLKVYWRQWRKFLAFAKEKGIKHVGQFSRELLNEYSKWAEDAGLAPNYVADLVTLILQVVNTLVANGYLNPSFKISIKMRKYEVDEAYCYSPEEVACMVEQCRNNSDPKIQQLGDIIMVLSYTGMRINELLSLHWNDINPETRFLTVRDDSARPVSERGQKSTKSSKSRRIPIHKDLVNWLQARKESRTGLLFKNPKGGKLGYCAIWESFVAHVRVPLAKKFPSKEGEKSFIDGAFHSLRHFYCSIHAQQGVSEMTMCQYLGHQSSRITRRYYHNNDQESLRLIDAVDVLGSYFKAGKSPAGSPDEKVVGRPKSRHGSGGRKGRKCC